MVELGVDAIEKAMTHIAGRGYTYRISVIKIRDVKMTAVIIRGVYGREELGDILSILKREANVEPILGVVRRVMDDDRPSVKMALGYINAPIS